MIRAEIIQELGRAYGQYVQYIDGLTEEEFLRSVNNKWTAGQQTEHLLRSVKPLSQGLQLPRFLFRLFFGKPNRPGRTYTQLVAKYHLKLQAGGRASGAFIPKDVSFSQKQSLLSALNNQVHKLQVRLTRYDEKDLDQYLIPHPLLGKLTIREMMYFTIYHVIHHQRNIQEMLQPSHS